MLNNKEYKIKRQTLVDIANVIREKTGKTDLIKVSDLDDAVKEITTGSKMTIIDIEASTGLPAINAANTNGIYRLYEDVQEPIVEYKDIAIPGPESGKTVTNVKFNTNTTDEEIIALFNTIFPESSEGNYFVCYESDNNYVRMAKSSGDAGTKWHYSILARVNGKSIITVWDAWLTIADNTISLGGTWAVSEVNYDNIYLTTKTNVTTGTQNETIKAAIYTTVEEIEYVEKREYLSVHIIENGQYVELIAK